jgi:hypothetical protein
MHQAVLTSAGRAESFTRHEQYASKRFAKFAYRVGRGNCQAYAAATEVFTQEK